jgi:hypothetical protein
VLCTVHADTSKIAKTLQRKLGFSGVYYRLDLEVILSFGLTEVKAQIAWVENVSLQASCVTSLMIHRCRELRRGMRKIPCNQFSTHLGPTEDQPHWCTTKFRETAIKKFG